jgi:serine/threonine protein kinase
MSNMQEKAHRVVGGIYRIGQVITSEGMLTTCTAYNRNTNDIVGLFMIEFPTSFPLDQVWQLLQPLERRRSLHSPYVIRVHNWGIDGTRAYIVTDPPRGVTLRHVLDTENVDLKRVLDLSWQITQGLKALHQHGVVGLDLRPQLITVDSVDTIDRAQIDDVGLRSLLKALGYVPSQRADDIGYLDPRYAAPEQLNAAYIGPWSDVYQVGLLIFELVTGRPPFVGHDPAETAMLQTTSPVPPMTQYRQDVPPSLQAAVERALAKNRAERFASADALLSFLNILQLSPRPAALPHAAGSQTRDDELTTEMSQVDQQTTVPVPPAQQRAAVQSSRDMPELTLPTEDGIYAYLCYEGEGAVPPQQFALRQKSVIVGRSDPKRRLSPDIDLSSIDPSMTVSRQHARIRFEEPHFYIEDLKSHNKTRLGSLPLIPMQSELLQHGDTIHLGSVCLKFQVPDRNEETLKEKQQ